jgi:ABC-2 type transport system permease protein
MDRLQAVWRKELVSHLVTPSLYGMGTVFLAVTGLNFWKLAQESAGSPTSMSVLLFGPIFFWIITLVLVTALTMRSFAEEKRSGSLELLMTAPLRDVDLVGGKFTAAFTLLVLIVLPVASYPWILRACSSGPWTVDIGQVLVGFCGVLLMGAFYTSVGVLISALSRGPMLAALGTFSALMLLFFLDAFWYAGPSAPMQRMIDHASAIQHVMDFSKGILDSRAVIFYLSFTGLMLYAAVKVIESKRRR